MSQPALPPRIANIPPGPPTPHNQVFLNMPVLRPAYLRPNVTHRTNRSEKAAATLAHRVGRQRVPQCHGCQAGRGPFTTCVTVNGHFGGACTNCKYTSASTSCSLRPRKSGPFYFKFSSLSCSNLQSHRPPCSIVMSSANFNLENSTGFRSSRSSRLHGCPSRSCPSRRCCRACRACRCRCFCGPSHCFLTRRTPSTTTTNKQRPCLPRTAGSAFVLAV
jgi:hypothetical protein